MVPILLIINYIVAFVILLRITNDEEWSYLITYILMEKDLDEQREFMENQELFRKAFCFVLLIPGAGLLLLLLTIISLNK